MNIAQIIADLRSERNRIDEAILSLERVAEAGRSSILPPARRRGRPPKRVADQVATFLATNGVGAHPPGPAEPWMPNPQQLAAPEPEGPVD
jgi:hypothetical protein